MSQKKKLFPHSLFSYLLNDINISSRKKNKKHLLSILPILGVWNWVKVKWLEVADCSRENGLRPRIHHILEFVSNRARAVNDPVFGNVITCEIGRGKLSNPNQSRGTRFSSQAKVVPSCERHGWPNDNPGVNQSSHNIFGKCIVCYGLH